MSSLARPIFDCNDREAPCLRRPKLIDAIDPRYCTPCEQATEGKYSLGFSIPGGLKPTYVLCGLCGAQARGSSELAAVVARKLKEKLQTTDGFSDSFVPRAAHIDDVMGLATHVPVFPCSRPDVPLILVERATQDLVQVRDWWKRWPSAFVGVPTGRCARLIAFEIVRRELNGVAVDWFLKKTPITRVHETPCCGMHYLFRTDKQYRSDAVFPGINLIAEGRYLIWWPLHGAYKEDAILPLPAGLLDNNRLAAPESQYEGK